MPPPLPLSIPLAVMLACLPLARSYADLTAAGVAAIPPDVLDVDDVLSLSFK